MNDAHDYHAWIGNTERREDDLTQSQIDSLKALLDSSPESPLPLGLQWLVCVDRVAQSELGPDGHPKRGEFLPPVHLPRRMWAAGNIRFLSRPTGPVPVSRESRITNIQHKQGRSGALVFVTVDHLFNLGDEPWLEEQHTIVYREASHQAFRQAPHFEAVDDTLYPYQQDVTTDAVQLFRYSAMTFNGHRIHYDQEYVTTIEGYPGLIVHGPLMATWLLNFVETIQSIEPGYELSFKVLAPVFVGETIRLLAQPVADGFLLAVCNERKEAVIEASLKRVD